MNKILIATDAFKPQINGVVRTLETTSKELIKKGYEVKFISPQDFKNFSWPYYKDISIALPGNIKKIIRDFKPDFIHIATEGTVGLMARNYCVRRKISFTTSFHTRFPEYLKKMHSIPLWISYAYLKWFHSKSQRVLAPTSSMKKILEQRGFKNVVVWHRGVDLETFKPYSQTLNEPKPILLYVGRISTEKNIKSFIDLNIRGTKIIVGDGPERKKLEDQYPSIKFLGSKSGESLARAYSEGDVFVFPSKSDTYGLVLLEALACGVPVAAYPEPGPLDILANSDASKCVFVDEDLEVAVKRALLTKDKKECHELAKVFSWENCTNTFLKYLIESHKV